MKFLNRGDAMNPQARLIDFVLEDLSLIRSSRPLVHCIANQVSVQFVANALLALGASPVMAHSLSEAPEVVSSAGALVLNTGTPDPVRARSMIRTARCARASSVPVVLDPVGAGISSFRRRLCASLLPFTASGGIRANASEVLALAEKHARHAGIDSSHTAGQAVSAAVRLLNRTGVVCITGAQDTICSPQLRLSLSLGHPLMTQVTGMGCAHSALFGAFLSVQRDLFRAAADSAVVMGVAGSEAGERAEGPGSFMVHFLDSLSSLTEKIIRARLRPELIREERAEKETI